MRGHSFPPEGSGQKVLFTIDSMHIRTAAGSANTSIVAILKNEILIMNSSDMPLQAPDLNGNMFDWIKVRYFNNQDENNPNTWSWIEGWVAQKFKDEVSGSTPGKHELHCINDYLRQAQKLTNARYICDKLIVAGWSRNAIYGMLGNMGTESQISPLFEQRNADDPGFGLVQWTSATKLTNWANAEGLDPNDIDTQLKRILHEVDTNADNAWQSRRHSSGMSFKEFTESSDTPERLAEIFLYCYERPGKEPRIERDKQARKWHDILELLQ